MSRNKSTIEAIQTILAESQWLQVNPNVVTEHLLSFTRKFLGVEKGAQFNIYEGVSNYGIFDTILIRNFGMDYEGEYSTSNIQHSLIANCHWEIHIPGLGSALDAHHPEYLITDYKGEIMRHDDFFGNLVLYYDPNIQSCQPKLENNDYTLTLNHIHEN